MKFTKNHEKQLREYMSKMDIRCCLTTDQWVSGSGRYTKPKALPPFVQKFDRKDFIVLRWYELPEHNTTARIAYQFFCDNPQRRTVLVLDREAFADFAFNSMRGNEF